ncbi:MAG: cobalamin-dependent protein [Dehalococcoidales bacterium]|nr:MAG: cobalamin-dependent protein [Dehalococcoidales bacterium]
MDEGMVGQPGVRELVEKAVVVRHMNVENIISKALTTGMEIVEQKFKAGEVLLPDVVASAQVVATTIEELKPHLAKSGIKAKGMIVVATVKGDFHDIGKHVVSMLLRAAGNKVEDLGNNIEPRAIVNAVREEQPQFLGLSGQLDSSVAQMTETIRTLEESGFRYKVKVIVGGRPVSKELARSIGADGYAKDGFDAVRVVESMSTTVHK